MKINHISILAFAVFFPLQFIQAQTTVALKTPTDPARNCKNIDNQKSKGTDQFVYPESIIEATNYEGRVQKEEMKNLLLTEIAKIKETLAGIEKKHALLIKLYPQLKNYQEITLSDTPGEWENQDYFSYKKVISFHYTPDEKINCVVIDSEKRNVHYVNIWKRKIIRLYIPYIQSMEMESLSHNSRLLETMDDASPEMQLHGMKLMAKHLQESLYSIDLMIASYYNKREKRNHHLMLL